MSEAPAATVAEWLRRDCGANYRKTMTVDDITSFADHEAECADLPMFKIVDDVGGGGALARMQCDRPYSAADERRWLAGSGDPDLDDWGGLS